jgi:hypothetical protein
MSYSGLHSVTEIFTSGRRIGGVINLLSRCCGELNCFLISSL